MSQLVRLMERQGYLKQVPDPTDTRAKVVQMTRRGEAVKTACVEVREELNQMVANMKGVAEARELETRLNAMNRLLIDVVAEAS